MCRNRRKNRTSSISFDAAIKDLKNKYKRAPVELPTDEDREAYQLDLDNWRQMRDRQMRDSLIVVPKPGKTT